MQRHTSLRNSGKLLAAAITSVGLVGFGASRSDGGLEIDMRVLSVTGAGNSVSAKTVIIPAADGRTVTMGVFARISGTNAVQQVYDPNEDGSELFTVNDDMLFSVVGAFQSVGPLLGNMVPTPGPNVSYASTFIPFNARGSQNGVGMDFDSDGDLDLGTVGTDPTNMWYSLAGDKVTAAASSTGGNGYAMGSTGLTFFPQPQDRILDATTNELRVGTVRFMVSYAPLDQASAQIQFVPRANGNAATALWFEDGIMTGKNPSTSAFSLGAPVVVAIPEPALLGLLGLASLGLLSRRRKPNRAASNL